jgi:hypothetical protein
MGRIVSQNFVRVFSQIGQTRFRLAKIAARTLAIGGLSSLAPPLVLRYN